MITLFRTIRQGLLTEGKTAKYLKYAIGEIILVVIGILIAVKINTRNTDQSNKKGEVFYLRKLQLNFEQDTLYLSERIKALENALLVHDSLKQQIADSSLKTFSKPKMLYTLIFTFGFSAETSTFDNLIATGKLELIENQTFVDSMFVYYNDLDHRTRIRSEGIETYSRNTIGPYIFEFDDIENPQLKPIAYSKGPFFKNAITYRKDQLSQLKNYYEASYSSCRNLLKSIDEQIKER